MSKSKPDGAASARSPFRLDGKVAVVTGAASGIGRASAHALARAGASVVVADIDGDGAARVASEIEAEGGRAVPQRADVACEADVEAMLAAAVAHFGGLDVLHNNAAATSPELLAVDTDVASLSLDVWNRVLATNLGGVMLGCKHAIPRMLARGGGSIVNTSSASGLVGDVVRAAYGASKAGVQSLTQYVATQYGKRGIRCNAIAPGVIETPALRANVAPEVVAIYERSHLTPRLGRAEDIASAVVFLASDEAAFVTGQILCVDGGLLAHHPAYGEMIGGGS